MNISIWSKLEGPARIQLTGWLVFVEMLLVLHRDHLLVLLILTNQNLKHDNCQAVLIKVSLINQGFEDVLELWQIFSKRPTLAKPALPLAFAATKAHHETQKNFGQSPPLKDPAIQHFYHLFATWKNRMWVYTKIPAWSLKLRFSLTMEIYPNSLTNSYIRLTPVRGIYWAVISM